MPRTAKVNPRVRRLHMSDPVAKKLIAIYESEGADAALSLHNVTFEQRGERFKVSKRQMLLLFAGLERLEGEQ